MINFKNINIVLEDKIIKSSLLIENGKIVSIGKTADMEGFDMPDLYLAPGLIDQHTHGGFTYDTMDATNIAIQTFAKNVLMEGTTSFLPTTMTQSFENIDKAITNVYNNRNYNQGANILGVHMEGPFISKNKKGAQKIDHISNISIEKFEKWNKNNFVKVITVAPELDNSLEFLKYLQERNIRFSIGHTDSDYKKSQLLIDNGCKNFTHGFNAMTGLHHRDIGVVGSFLVNDNVYVELICDLIHVCPDAVKFLYDTIGSKNIILVTDSMRAKGSIDKISEIGGQKVIVENNEARLESGALAGSVLKLNNACLNISKVCNLDMPEVFKMASTNPAKNLDVFDKKGSIDVLKDADLIIIDKQYDVKMTIVSGKILYKKEN